MSVIRYKTIYCIIILLSLIPIKSYGIDFKSFKTGNKKHVILSIDGGGVRGIIPAKILQEIEEISGHQIYSLVDTISGTSTGGIIALSLSTSKSDGNGSKFHAKDLLNMYLNESNKIFSTSVWHQIKTVAGIVGPKYDRTSLDELFLEKFGNSKVSQLLNHTIIFSYNLNTLSPHIWDTLSLAKRNKDFYIKDIAAATSAAPTYFGAVEVRTIDGKCCHNQVADKHKDCNVACIEVDGGLFANNPELLTLGKVLKSYPQIKMEDILLISIGTGNTEPKDFKKGYSPGMLGWLVNGSIIDLILNSSSDVSTWSIESLGINVIRLQVDLNHENSLMDDISSKNLNLLFNNTVDYLNENRQLLKELCNFLVTNLNT